MYHVDKHKNDKKREVFLLTYLKCSTWPVELKKILKKKLNFEEKSNLKAQEIDKVSFPYFTAFGFSL